MDSDPQPDMYIGWYAAKRRKRNIELRAETELNWVEASCTLPMCVGSFTRFNFFFCKCYVQIIKLSVIITVIIVTPLHVRAMKLILKRNDCIRNFLLCSLRLPSLLLLVLVIIVISIICWWFFALSRTKVNQNWHSENLHYFFFLWSFTIWRRREKKIAHHWYTCIQYYLHLRIVPIDTAATNEYQLRYNEKCMAFISLLKYSFSWVCPRTLFTHCFMVLADLIGEMYYHGPWNYDRIFFSFFGMIISYFSMEMRIYIYMTNSKRWSQRNTIHLQLTILRMVFIFSALSFDSSFLYANKLRGFSPQRRHCKQIDI